MQLSYLSIALVPLFAQMVPAWTVYFFKDGCGDFDPTNTTATTGVDELTADGTEGCENAPTSNYHSVYVDGIASANMNLELFNDDSCTNALNNIDPSSVIKQDGCYTAPISDVIAAIAVNKN
ncbi:hypothetical protein EV356DRAFT_579133 [Viridothelium virens]|uniref:Ecp2 effector protein domain-containing protein n=1 Tax=Viridothelium virens TaxID=1048519 RepID=A0A6A6H1K1_VIRVR|nr:hypothetical protein EV356DRAFT_579133 [Viridothelium virens]